MQEAIISQTSKSKNTVEVAGLLLERLKSIIRGLEHGEASLPDRRVCVLSRDPEDVLLARLLTAFGAKPTFLTPEPTPWHPDIHLAILQELTVSLARTFDSLAFDSFDKGECFGLAVEACPFSERPASGTQPYDIVLAIGVVAQDEEQSVEDLKWLARLVKHNGSLEILPHPNFPARAQTFQALSTRAGNISLGVRRCDMDSWRLSLIHLPAPLDDCPIEDRSNEVVMSHAHTRHLFCSRFVAGLDVLEAGSALGMGTRLFAQAGARKVLGLELMPESVLEARRKTTDPRIEYRQADLNLPLPCEDASFDVIICTEVLEHIVNHEAALKEYYRILRPGGRLIISVPDSRMEDGWTRVNRFGNPYHLRVPTRNELECLLTPFRDVRYFRQVDVVGTVVLEDDSPNLEGVFKSYSPDMARQVRTVILAVCSKGVAHKKVSDTSNQLLLYRTFSDYQLESHEYAFQLENEIIALKHRCWKQGNRIRQEGLSSRHQEGVSLDSVKASHSVSLWRNSGGVVVMESPTVPDSRLKRLAEFLAQAPCEVAAPTITPLSPVWVMSQTETGDPLLSPLGTQEINSEIHSVLLPVAENQVSFRVVWNWRRLGAKKLWFYEGDGWRVTDIEGAVAKRLLRQVRKTYLGKWLTKSSTSEWRFMRWAMARQGRRDETEQMCGPDGLPTLTEWRKWIVLDNGRAGSKGTNTEKDNLQVVHLVPPGASEGELQSLTNPVAGMEQKANQITILTLSSEGKHPAGTSGDRRNTFIRAVYTSRKSFPVPENIPVNLLASIHPAHLDRTLALCAEIAALRPDVLHCWGDEQNVVGGVAGLLAGVPRILLTTPGSPPTDSPRRFPAISRLWYRLLTTSNRICLSSPSVESANWYADLLRVPADSIELLNVGSFIHESVANGNNPSAETYRVYRQAS